MPKNSSIDYYLFYKNLNLLVHIESLTIRVLYSCCTFSSGFSIVPQNTANSASSFSNSSCTSLPSGTVINERCGKTCIQI